MRQLTSVDAQFLAMEDANTFGHVSGLCILDPSTAPGGKLTIEDIRTLVDERLHLLPPFRWRLAPGAAVDRPPVLDRGSRLRPRLPRPRDRDPAARRPAPARADDRADRRPQARSRPPAVGAVPDPRPRGRQGRRRSPRSTTPRSTASRAPRSSASCSTSAPRAVRSSRPSRRGACRRRRRSRWSCAACIGMPRQPWRMIQALPTTLVHAEALPADQRDPGAVAAGPHHDAAARAAARARRTAACWRPRAVRAPKTRFNAPISPHRRFAYASLSLDRVREIKNAIGITVNDVVVADLRGRRYATG